MTPFDIDKYEEDDMLVITGTSYEIYWKQKIHDVLVLNELGGNTALAYSLSFAGSKSGYSFGYAQWDLAANATARGYLLDILQNATDVNGQFIVDDGNPSTGRTNDNLVQTLMNQAVIPGGNSLTGSQISLINQAISSIYGQGIIDQHHDQYLGDVLIHVDNIVTSISNPQDRAFLESDVAKLFLADYHNQFNIGLNGPLDNFLHGQNVVIGGGVVQLIGQIGIADLINFYFSTQYATATIGGLNDELRRFANIIEINGGVYQLPQDSVARAEEAKGLIWVYQDFLKNRQSQLNSLGSNYSRFNSAVLEPARVALIGQYVSDPGIGISINGEVVVGEDQSGIGRNNKHSADSDIDLHGTSQNDLILGESGLDSLRGEGGNDVLYGGANADVLIGGTDNDYLDGGQGNDIYFYNTGNGNDTIHDQDDRGAIIFDGDLLTGGHRIADGVYRSDDSQFLYTYTGNDLTITNGASGSIAISNSNGSFGIDLQESDPPPPLPPDTPFESTRKPKGKRFVGTSFLLVYLLCCVAPRSFSAEQLVALTPNPTAIDCGSRLTTVEIGNCIRDVYEQEDKRLNFAFQKLTSILKNFDLQADSGIVKSKSEHALREAQRAWIKYRDNDCYFRRTLSSGGTAASSNQLMCLLRMTKARADELEHEVAMLAAKGG